MLGEPLKRSSPELRKKIAREAANLLYFGMEKEYKQAKLKAAKTIGVHILPTNLEVAMKLDKIAEENEGPARQKRLIQMRECALKIMRILKAYKPFLVGSAWRGTIHHKSDIDIVVYNDEPSIITEVLKQNSFKILKTEWVTVVKQGEVKNSFHIYLQVSNNGNVEIVVRNIEESNRKEKCFVYGGEITGLNIQELKKLLKQNPTKKFIPW